MIVCHCHALTDRDIRAVSSACGGCPNALEQMCGAGGACGGCKPHVEMIVKAASGHAAAKHADAEQRRPIAV